jgi:DNA (cytosine-5)-methyltransferase 1
VFLLAHAAAPVGDANLARLEGRRAPVVQSGNEIVAWPPGPADDEGWRRWLSAGGPPPAMPRVRRGADGLACRVDRLRCLGNAVVPQQAAFAWRILRERLGCS